MYHHYYSLKCFFYPFLFHLLHHLYKTYVAVFGAVQGNTYNVQADLWWFMGGWAAQLKRGRKYKHGSCIVYHDLHCHSCLDRTPGCLSASPLQQYFSLAAAFAISFLQASEKHYVLGSWYYPERSPWSPPLCILVAQLNIIQTDALLKNGCNQ